MSTLMSSFAIKGVDSYPVDIEVYTSFGKPSMSMIGLADLAIKEAGERIRASLEQTGYEMFKGKIVFNFATSDIKKSGTHFDDIRYQVPLTPNANGFFFCKPLIQI